MHPKTEYAYILKRLLQLLVAQAREVPDQRCLDLDLADLAHRTLQ